MAKTKYTNVGVARIIENEGLEYAIRHYMSGDSIVDPKLAEMWDEASKLLDEIEKYASLEEIEVDD